MRFRQDVMETNVAEEQKFFEGFMCNVTSEMSFEKNEEVACNRGRVI